VGLDVILKEQKFARFAVSQDVAFSVFKVNCLVQRLPRGFVVRIKKGKLLGFIRACHYNKVDLVFEMLFNIIIVYHLFNINKMKQ